MPGMKTTGIRRPARRQPVLDVSERVTVRSWHERDGRRVDGRVRDLAAAELAVVMERLWKGRRRAVAHRPGDFADEVGGVISHPVTGRLAWWAEVPEAVDTTPEATAGVGLGVA
jgi:hypothetical protein